MGINIAKPTYAKWPVKFKLSEPDGTIREEEHVIHYALGPVDSATCGDSIIGWDAGAFDKADGTPLEFSRDAVGQLFANPEIAAGLVSGFQAIARGEHLMGNSPNSSAG